MQSRVVTLSLGVEDLTALDKRRHPTELDGDGLVGRGFRRDRARRAGLRSLGHDSTNGFGQTLSPDRLHDVVGHLELERRHRMLVVCRDEDDLGPVGEAGEHLRQRESVEAGHGDVGEDDVDRVVVQGLEGLGA